jgi:hypothetical protein
MKHCREQLLVVEVGWKKNVFCKFCTTHHQYRLQALSRKPQKVPVSFVVSVRQSVCVYQRGCQWTSCQQFLTIL